jgi:hypothetical protein
MLELAELVDPSLAVLADKVVTLHLMALLP